MITLAFWTLTQPYFHVYKTYINKAHSLKATKKRNAALTAVIIAQNSSISPFSFCNLVNYLVLELTH